MVHKLLGQGLADIDRQYSQPGFRAAAHTDALGREPGSRGGTRSNSMMSPGEAAVAAGLPQRYVELRRIGPPLTVDAKAARIWALEQEVGVLNEALAAEKVRVEALERELELARWHIAAQLRGSAAARFAEAPALAQPAPPAVPARALRFGWAR